MKKNTIVIIFLFTVILVTTALVIFFYIFNFGTEPSNDHSDWGAFGDYFGGILNPFLAFIAFLGVLLSLNIQNKQLELIDDGQLAKEVLIIIKDIDKRIDELLKTDVSKQKNGSVLIHHMVSEAERVAGNGSSLEESDSYFEFKEYAQKSGKEVEAYTRELRRLILNLYGFLKKYSQEKLGSYSPLIEYYKYKNSSLVLMLNDIDKFDDKDEVIGFFRMSDS